MKKLLVLVVVLAVVGGLAAWLMSTMSFDRPASNGTTATETASAQQDEAAVDAAKKAANAKRARDKAEEAAQLLAVAGVVKTDGDKPVAGATVEAFAAPAVDDGLSDEDRIARDMLVRM